ncbi:hypothetical protein CASFOL_004158 [Castilleja foliolosa]|uniref:Aquaporin NIP-type n=1 Tax=Castilleja foliolosa TaxID=1961234 RepID=A0ABD3EJW0_9LAMI
MSSTDITRIEEGIIGNQDNESRKGTTDNEASGFCSSSNVIAITQKVIAEAIGTYFLVFIGCGSIVVNKIYGSVTFPGVCIAWGLIVMVMIYAVGHISGAHFNPAVTITFAIFRQFSCKLVPLYMLAQVLGSILASGTLYLVFDVTDEAYFGTIPTGSNVQSLVIEFIASFLLMFVISGVATDNRSTGELAGIAIGMTILIDLLVAIVADEGVASSATFLASCEGIFGISCKKIVKLD